MTYQPTLPATGYVGWRFLQTTLATQKATYVASAEVTRAEDHFRENIASIKTADDLVADRQLLQVALGAFGLDDDINNTAFIRKVLAEGTLSDTAFANRLTDKRYAALTNAFGFGDLGGLTGIPGFADDILARYEDRQFERAVGEVDSDMRLALSLSDGLKDATANGGSTNVQWLTIMGSTPLRTVFETALGFPSSFGAIDIDQQLVAFQERAEATFGTSDLAEIAADPEIQEKAIRLFLVRSEMANNASISSGNVALSLLRASGLG